MDQASSTSTTDSSRLENESNREQTTRCEKDYYGPSNTRVDWGLQLNLVFRPITPQDSRVGGTKTRLFETTLTL